MSEFTPEQIQEILDIFFDNFAHRQYIGQRYVPIFGRKGEDSIEWDNTGTYEPLTIVLHEGNSYTSRQFVPVGVAITNQAYWANTGNYNAQVEAYRQEVVRLAAMLPDTDFDAVNTVKKYVDDEIDTEETARIYQDSLRIVGFANVAAMKASTNIAAGMICHTDGFHTSGDGGAAYYEIRTTGTANEMDVIACGDLYAHLKPENINVKNFGAYGNGTNDDSQSFQRYIDYVYTLNENVIVIPSGLYLLNSMLVIKDKTNIVGIDNPTLIAGDNIDAVIKYDFSDSNIDSNVKPLVISNVKIDGDSKAAKGIWLVKTDKNVYLRNSVIENLTVKNCTYGLYMDDTDDSFFYASTIRNCVFDSSVYMVTFGDTVTIENCSFGRLTDNVFTQYNNATTFKFENNNVTGHCVFNLKLNASFINNIFELQRIPSKDFITINTIDKNLVMYGCSFSNLLNEGENTYKLFYTNATYLLFENCTFTDKDAPGCYGTDSVTGVTRCYGCVVGNGIYNFETVLSGFNNVIFDVCVNTYGQFNGFNKVNANQLTSFGTLKVNNYISIKAVNTAPDSDWDDNTLYIIRSERKLCLSLTGNTVYEIELTLRS